MPDAVSWILIVICLIFSFFFSLCETALSCVNKFKMQAEAENGNKRAKLVVKVTDNYQSALATILIGNNIAAVAISSISTVLFYKYLSSIGMEGYASLISSIVMTFIVYIFGDTLPKTIAKQIPNSLSKLTIYPLYFFILIFKPVYFCLELIGNLFKKIFHIKPNEEFTQEDFSDVVDKIENEGIIEEEQADIIQSALDFSDTKVKQVFTPSDKMLAICIDDLSIDKLNEILIKSPYSRIPVYKGKKRKYIGILHVKTYVKAYMENNELDIRDILQKPYYVSTRVGLVNLFNGFKTHRTHIALVRNNNHEVIGMVTMEDVLEELVDDISEPIMKEKKA